MNLLRAISLGGGAGDLRGNDSTILICHVQLCVLAIDWVLNILVDNFLQDPLVVLIIFICQALLLIIGLIFYLMASANQAMKEGIHEKLLRHHQLTVALWTLYFSTLVCWYTWTLKRSWPSAGDHFSFTFSGGEYDGKHKLEEESTILSTMASTTTDSIFDLPTTISLSTAADSSLPSTSENLMLATRDNENFVSSTTPQTFTETTESVPFLMERRLMDSMSEAIQSLTKEVNNTGPTRNKSQGLDSETLERANGTAKDDYYKFFWSPGFISVYVIERAASLLFYAAYILGTMHIVNAHLLDKQTGVKNNLRTGKDSQKGFPDNRNQQDKDAYLESDSNLDDNFIRQLEDQDADPFDNEQYDYQYKVNENRDNGLLDHHYDSDNNVHAETSSETDDAFSKDKPRKLKSDRLKNNLKQMVPQTKGALKNMMIASNLRKNSGPTITKPTEWFENTDNIDAPHNSSRARAFSEHKDGRTFVIETELAPVTTSSSIDTMATGSTDELLVAHVFTREDKNFTRPQAFRNDYGQSDENLYSYTH